MKQTKYNSNKRRRGSSKTSNSGRDNNYKNERSTNNNSSTNCMSTKEYDNDWRWYVGNNEQLAKDVASIAFGAAVGGRDRVLNTSAMSQFEPGFLVKDKRGLPGIMALHYTPTIGYSEDSQSPVNIAMRNVYTKIRYANSGARNYDAPNVAMYLAAMDSMHSYIAWLKFLYMNMGSYSVINRYLPKAVIMAEGVDCEDLKTHLADFRAYINTLAVQVGAYAVPANMPLFERHKWLVSHIWKDTDENKAQMYIFRPEGFYRYGYYGFNDERDVVHSNATSEWQCVLHPLAVDENGELLSSDQVDFFHLKSHNEKEFRLLTFKNLTEYGNKLLEPIVNSEDFNILSGDILKAYGDTGIFKVSAVSENDFILPEYSEEVLTQIHNSNALGFNQWNPQIQEVIVDPEDSKKNNYIRCSWDTMLPFELNPGTHSIANDSKIAAKQMLIPMFANRYLNFKTGPVEAKDVLVATRFTVIPTGFGGISSLSTPEGSTGVAFLYGFDNVGSELMNYSVIYYYGEYDNEWLLTESEALTYCDMTRAGSEFDISRLALMSKFDWHPIMNMVPYSTIKDDDGKTAITSVSKWWDVFADLNYYAIVTHADLFNMSQACLLSEFDIMQFGKAM